jgi:hypothetical protein
MSGFVKLRVSGSLMTEPDETPMMVGDVLRLGREEDGAMLYSLNIEILDPDRKPCDCIHDEDGVGLVTGQRNSVHDPATGACLVVNPAFGPCPCAATPGKVRDVLTMAWMYTRQAKGDYLR